MTRSFRTSPLLPSPLRAGASVCLALGLILAGCAPEESSGPQAPRSEEAGRPAQPSVGGPALPLEAGAAAGRSLVLITLDTTRADRLGSYGYEAAETPHLDRLAAEGVRFADAVTPVPMTLPAHASLLTGLAPPRHGVRANGEYSLGAEHTTLAEVLSGAGYETAAFVASFVLAPRYGLDQGFGVYDARLEATEGAVFGRQTERSAEAVTDAALGWLTAEGRSEPFFLWVHYFDPHDPYEPPEPWASRFADRPYDGEIAFMDAQAGRLLDALEEAGLSERSVIVAAGDHGESLGEHGERYHSRTLYEGAVRVPLLVAVPGLLDGGTVVDDRVVGLADLAPTLTGLLGVEPPMPPEGALDGRDLLEEEGEAARAVYLETLNTYLDNGWAPLYALRRHGDKYIEAPRPEYYDLTADPEEGSNLLAGARSGAEPPEAAALAERLEGMLAGQPGVAQAMAERQPADPETRRRLEALGYLSGGGGTPAPEEAGELPDPKDMLPLHEQLLAARSALQEGRPQEAARLARELVQLAPRDRAALQVLGEAYATLGKPEQAERALRRHLEIGPSVGATVLLAQVVMQQRRFEEAEVLLDRAEELDPEHGAVPLARGDLRLFQGRPAEARELYREARRIDPYRFTGLAEARIERLERLIRRSRNGPSP